MARRNSTKQMPRPAIRAIAGSGIFLSLCCVFLAYYAARGPFHPGFAWLNAATALFLFAGSVWLLVQLARSR